jgi:hypothetical protein
MRDRGEGQRENVAIAPDWLMEAAILLVVALAVGAIVGLLIRASGPGGRSPLLACR